MVSWANKLIILHKRLILTFDAILGRTLTSEDYVAIRYLTMSTFFSIFKSMMMIMFFVFFTGNFKNFMIFMVGTIETLGGSTTKITNTAFGLSLVCL